MIPDSVTSIGGGAFRGCSGLTSITIPNGVTSIGGDAFYECSGLTSLVIPDSVTSIGDEAFSGCSGLTSLVVPDSVTSIGDGAFRGCFGLVEMTLPFVGSQRGNSGSSSALFGYIFGISSCSGGTATVQDYSSSAAATYSIPSSLRRVVITDETVLGYGAFYNCSGLTSITIPDSVTSIGDSAFSGCSGLTSITIPDSVTSIGDNAFYGCSRLTSITIPDSVTSIGNRAFSGCVSIRDVGVPGRFEMRSIFPWAYNMITNAVVVDGVTSIGDNAFYGCSRLTSLVIPDSVTSIGDEAFSGCSGLTSVTIPDGVTSIRGSAFSWCYGLAEVTADPKWGSCFSSATNLMFTIPDGVTSIGGSAFYNCSGLTSITIPDSVTSIGSRAFSSCSSLAILDMPFHFLNRTGEMGIPEGCIVRFGAPVSDDGIANASGMPLALFASWHSPWSECEDTARGDGRCLRSGEIPTNGISRLVTGVSGAGRFSFAWKISAARGDYCRFYVDGELVKSIQRSTTWATVQTEIGTGSHTLQWIYERGTGSATGEDAAFVDDVDWRPDVTLSVSSAFGTADPAGGLHVLRYGDTVAAGVAEPADADGVRRVCTGWTGTGSVPASGTDRAVSFAITNDTQIVWNWRTDYRTTLAVKGPATADFSESWVPNGTTKVVRWTPTVPYHTASLSGDTAGVSFDEAARTISIPSTRARNLVLTVTEITLASALDTESLAWTTDEAAPWFPQVGTSADEEDAAQAGPAAGDAASGLETTLQGAGTLSWTWRLSSGDATGVDVFLDGEWLDAYAPGTDWSEASLDVAGSGTHTVRFEFWNAGSTADATAWIDQVVWTGDAPFGGQLRLVSASQTEAVFSTTAYTGGDPTPVLRILEIAADATFASVAKSIPLADVTEKTVEMVSATGLSPETGYWARLRLSQGGAAWTSDAVPFATQAHVAPTLGTPIVEARAIGATISVPVTALGSDGGAVEVSVAATVANTGEAAGTAAPATLAAPGTAVLDLEGLAPETVYRFIATARSVATGLETSVSGGFTTDWAETPRIAAGGSGSGERPALCFLPSESGTGEDFVILIDNPIPGLWYPVYTNGTPGGRFAVQSCGKPTSADGGYIVRVPAVESALFVKIGVSKTRLEPGTPEQGVSLEQAEWTTGTYSSFSPSAVSENLLRQSGAAYTGGNAHESEDGYRMDDPAAMTNGSIDSGMTLSDKQYRFAVESRQTLSWSFPSAATVREVRVYNIWGDSGRDRIDIESVDALVGGSWVPLAPDSVCCQDSSAGSYDDGKPGRPYAILAAPNGGAIATGATALRIVWGTAESGFVGVGEVEVIGSF